LALAPPSQNPKYATACLHGAQQKTHRTLLLQSSDGTDRWTDRQTDRWSSVS